MLDARVGDTMCLAKQYKEGKATGNEIEALPGYADSVPMVYCGLFPVDADDYDSLRDSLGKLCLNDAALSYESETPGAMGFGFRCGFLGLLHMVEFVNGIKRSIMIWLPSCFGWEILFPISCQSHATASALLVVQPNQNTCPS